jgi:hypothetical protein
MAKEIDWDRQIGRRLKFRDLHEFLWSNQTHDRLYRATGKLDQLY